MAVDLFADLGRPDEDLHPQFLTLRDHPNYSAARGMLIELSEALHDPDGNLVEQFQTTGFDSRTFEIFLFAMLSEAGLSIDRSYDRPDFIVERAGVTVALEAVTANPRNPTPYTLVPDLSGTTEQRASYLRNDVAIRLGSPLFTKLTKKYWELPHVAGIPFIVAIQDFHGPGSLLSSSTPLEHYLFGSEQTWYHDETGKLVIDNIDIEEHRSFKRIPSGFFSQPNAEFVSAVLFSNAGTIAKFNRMGQEGRYRSPETKQVRFGTCYRPDPNAVLPDPFAYIVGSPAKPFPERWREGTLLIHNPRAAIPVPEGWLGAACEDRWTGEGCISTFADHFFPYASITEIFGAEVPMQTVERRANAHFEVLSEQFPP